jgi:hypothetical protein
VAPKSSLKKIFLASKSGGRVLVPQSYATAVLKRNVSDAGSSLVMRRTWPVSAGVSYVNAQQSAAQLLLNDSIKQRVSNAI